jgi:YNFM family putative membrane transporter
MGDVPTLDIGTAESSGYIARGTPAFRRVNWALFAAGFATFGLL